MIPFHVPFEAGAGLCEQIVYAAKKALIAGQMRPGDAFPSVRVLSKELKINPNTAHKVVTQLLAEGLIEVYPGRGTVVAARPAASETERSNLLQKELEHVVVEAQRLGLEFDEVAEALRRHWRRVGGTQKVGRR